jgi:hypothetical protein
VVQESLTVIQIVSFFFFSDINYKMTTSQHLKFSSVRVMRICSDNSPFPTAGQQSGDHGGGPVDSVQVGIHIRS